MKCDAKIRAFEDINKKNKEKFSSFALFGRIQNNKGDMGEILYRNDKKRLILYELLMLERKLTKGEASEYKRLKAARTEAAVEKRELLRELISGGYIETPDGMQIGEHTFTSDVMVQRKRITPTGIDLLKKELPSELEDEESQSRDKYFARLKDWIDLIKSAWPAILFLASLLSLLFEWFEPILQEVLAYLLSYVQGVTQL